MTHHTSNLGLLLVGVLTVAGSSWAQQRGAPLRMAAPAAVHAATPVARLTSVHAAQSRVAPADMIAHPSASGTHAPIPRNDVRPAAPRTSSRTQVFIPAGSFDDAGVAGDGLPVPGLGFDFVHFAAVHPNLRHTHNLSGQIFPFFGGSIFVPVLVPEEVPAAAEVQPEGAPAETAEREVRSRERESSRITPARGSGAPTATSAPESEYVFVRRDGTVFFAVAYSWLKDRLQYVTPDGLRRMATLDSLDLDVTRQFNEQRGTLITLPG